MKALSSNVLFLQFLVLIVLVIIDVVVNVARAIAVGKFEWEKLLQFLRTNLVPYVLVWGVLAGAGWLADWLAIVDATLAGIVIVVDIVYALMVARLAESIYAGFRDLGISET